MERSIRTVATAGLWVLITFLAISTLILAIGSFVSIVYLVGHFAFGWR